MRIALILHALVRHSNRLPKGRVFETGSNILGKLSDSYCEIPFATATFRSQAALKMDRE